MRLAYNCRCDQKIQKDNAYVTLLTSEIKDRSGSLRMEVEVRP